MTQREYQRPPHAVRETTLVYDKRGKLSCKTERYVIPKLCKPVSKQSSYRFPHVRVTGVSKPDQLVKLSAQLETLKLAHHTPGLGSIRPEKSQTKTCCKHSGLINSRYVPRERQLQKKQKKHKPSVKPSKPVSTTPVPADQPSTSTAVSKSASNKDKKPRSKKGKQPAKSGKSTKPKQSRDSSQERRDYEDRLLKSDDEDNFEL